MKKRAFILIIVFTLIMNSVAFSQNVQKDDPWVGVWSYRDEKDENVWIFVDGVIIEFFTNGGSLYVQDYTVSGNVLILEGERLNFTILDNNRIFLDADGGVVFVRQNATEDIKALLENYLRAVKH